MVEKFKIKDDSISVAKKNSSRYKEQFNKKGRTITYKEAQTNSDKPKIALSDKEFGKY